jgi:hypothetical protein
MRGRKIDLTCWNIGGGILNLNAMVDSDRRQSMAQLHSTPPVPPLNEQWDKAEIKKIAETDGRPLEVRCAMAFMRAGWQAQLGSYYVDPMSNVPRELDVLVQRERVLRSKDHPGRSGELFRIRLRVLCSCKGFPPEHSPITYSLSEQNHSELLYPPILPGKYRGPHKIGRLKDVATTSAKLIISKPDLQIFNQAVAFDVFQWNDPSKGNKRDFKQYEKIGDKVLYGGLDSAVKACEHWHYLDIQAGEQFVTLSLPLLLLAVPWWDFPIDHGAVGDPELRFCAQMTNLHPVRAEHIPIANASITALLCAEARLVNLIAVLNELWEKFNSRLDMVRPFDEIIWPEKF